MYKMRGKNKWFIIIIIIIFLSKNVLGHLFAAQSLGSSDDRRLDGDDGW